MVHKKAREDTLRNRTWASIRFGVIGMPVRDCQSNFRRGAYASGTEALLKARVTVLETENLQQKKQCALVVWQICRLYVKNV